MNNKNVKLIAIVKFVILMILLIGIPAYIYFFNRDIIANLKSIDDIMGFLNQYRTTSIFVYIGFQVAQTVLSIIPGHAIQLVAGYLYKFWIGYLISMIGITIGTVITFNLGRLLGKDAIQLFLGDQRFSRVVSQINSKRSLFIIFLIYLIPGLPKDFLGYGAGASKMRFLTFMVLTIAGRTPGVMGSVLIGSMIDEKDYASVIILSTAFVIVFLAAFIKRKAILKWLDKK